MDLEIRWLDCQSQGVDDSTMDCLDVDGVSKFIDERTRLISIGKALQNWFEFNHFAKTYSYQNLKVKSESKKTHVQKSANS